MEWSEAETIKFIELYREHECLWNEAKQPNAIGDFGKNSIGIE